MRPPSQTPWFTNLFRSSGASLAAACKDDSDRSMLHRLGSEVIDTYRLERDAHATPIVMPAAAESTVVGWDWTLHASAHATILLAYTLPGWLHPAHDHQLEAIICGLEGIEHHRLYTNQQALTQIKESSLMPGDIWTMQPDDIHAISAPEGPALALHIYLGPLDETDRSLFDARTGAAERFTPSRYYQNVLSV
jgi:predicted metal-dependent enzyme (double-stranded beta helix superfamily)